MRRTRDLVLAVAAAATALIATAAPALAHATFDKASVPADAQVSLQMRVPLERPGFTNARIEALLPGPFGVTACEVPSSTWRCDIDSRSQAPDTLVTWSALGAGTSDDIRFTLGLRTPGSEDAREYLIPVIQTYSDGEESRWTQESGNEPAPRLTVTDSRDSAAAAPAPTSTPAPAPTERSAPPASSPSPRPEAADEEEAPEGRDDGAASATTQDGTPSRGSGAGGSEQPDDQDADELAAEDAETDGPPIESAEPDARPSDRATLAVASGKGEGRAFPTGLALVGVVLIGATGTVALRELRRGS